MNDPLLPHLLCLLDRGPKDSFILAGGLGLRVKRTHQIMSGTQSLAESVDQELPEARATTDIDLFLKIELFTRPAVGLALRRAIDELGYKERTPKWQFEKDFPEAPGKKSLVLDLLARRPQEGSGVKFRTLRVGSGSGTDLHGRETEEAFAVEEDPIICNIADSGKIVRQVKVANPYAMLNMKIRAAHDWNRYQQQPWPLRERQEPPSAKHAFDATLVIAMLTEDELTRCKKLAGTWAGVGIADQIKFEAEQLFGSDKSPGWIEARRQGMFDDHALIWGTMMEALGLT